MTFLACHKDQRFYYFQQSMGLSHKFWLASFSASIKGRAKVGSLPHLWITVIKLLLVRLSTNKPTRVFPKTQGERWCVRLNHRLTILYQKTADESLRFTDLPNNRNSFSSTKASDFGRWDKKGLRQEIDNFYFFFFPNRQANTEFWTYPCIKIKWMKTHGKVRCWLAVGGIFLPRVVAKILVHFSIMIKWTA